MDGWFEEQDFCFFESTGYLVVVLAEPLWGVIVDELEWVFEVIEEAFASVNEVAVVEGASSVADEGDFKVFWFREGLWRRAVEGDFPKSAEFECFSGLFSFFVVEGPVFPLEPVGAGGVVVEDDEGGVGAVIEGVDFRMVGFSLWRRFGFRAEDGVVVSF